MAAVFDLPQSRSDGRSVLLKACDQALGLTEALACLGGNPMLKRAAAGLMEPVWKEYKPPGKRPQERYGDCLHGARSWNQRHRVVMQAGLALQEGRQPKENPRSVVTNIQGGARRIYQRT